MLAGLEKIEQDWDAQIRKLYELESKKKLEYSKHLANRSNYQAEISHLRDIRIPYLEDRVSYFKKFVEELEDMESFREILKLFEEHKDLKNRLEVVVNNDKFQKLESRFEELTLKGDVEGCQEILDQMLQIQQTDSKRIERHLFER